MRSWDKLPVIDDFEDLRRNFVEVFVYINKIFICDQLGKLRKQVNEAGIMDIDKRYGPSSFNDITLNDVDEYYVGPPYWDYWDGGPIEGEFNLFTENIDKNEEFYNVAANNVIGEGRQVIEALKKEAIDTATYTDNYTVEDYRHLDFWDNNYGTWRSNDEHYRYHNEIPIYQKSMQIRHYDRSAEGLRQRGSLVNDRFRKYDLKDIENEFYFYTD